MISLSASLGFGPPARRVKVGAHVRGETMAREARSETVATKKKRAEKRPRGGARARAFWRRHASIETEAAHRGDLHFSHLGFCSQLQPSDLAFHSVGAHIRSATRRDGVDCSTRAI